MNKRTLIILRVNEQAEGFYQKSQELGNLAALAFDEMRGAAKNRHRSQMTGLENIAETTLKVSDVLDYIKKQIARREGWTAVIKDTSFGERLKAYIEKDLKMAVEEVCTDIHIENKTEDDARNRQRIYLDLIRQMIRQVVVHYEYMTASREGQSND